MAAQKNSKIGDMQSWHDGIQSQRIKKFGNTVSDFQHWYDGMQYAPAIPAETGNFMIFMQ